MRGSRTSVAAVGLALLAPAPAVAQGGGVFVDPDSPTGKQYQLPLESARRQADPGSDGRLAPPGARPSGTGPAALFGEGIAKASSAGKRSGSNDSAGKSKPGGKAGGSNGSSSPKPDSGSSGSIQAAVSNPGAPSGGVGSTLLIAAGGGLVLLIGGLAGFLLRRRSAD